MIIDHGRYHLLQILFWCHRLWCDILFSTKCQINYKITLSIHDRDGEGIDQDTIAVYFTYYTVHYSTTTLTLSAILLLLPNSRQGKTNKMDCYIGITWTRDFLNIYNIDFGDYFGFSGLEIHQPRCDKNKFSFAKIYNSFCSHQPSSWKILLW